MPSWIWRVIFCLFFFFAGTGLLVYILLWIFMPKEH
jgi:phage shock protein PspC (stress-responsive transcriptional regulator)